MSRHRNVRHMMDEYYDEDLDYDESKSEAADRVMEILGDEFSRMEIEETLDYYDLDESETVKWLIKGFFTF